MCILAMIRMSRGMNTCLPCANSLENRKDDDMSDSLGPRLELDPDAMRALGYRVVDTLVRHYVSLAAKPVSQVASREEMDMKLWTPPPQNGRSVDEVMSILETDVFPNMMLTNHPRFF